MRLSTALASAPFALALWISASPARADEPAPKAEPTEEVEHGYILAGAIGGFLCIGGHGGRQGTDYLIGGRAEYGYPIVSRWLYAAGSGFYTGGESDGRSGYGLVALGLRGFIGAPFGFTSNAEFGYGMFHSHITQGLGNKDGPSLSFSAGMALRLPQVYATLEMRLAATPGLVLVAPTLMAGTGF